MNNHQSLTQSLKEAQVRTAFEAAYETLSSSVEASGKMLSKPLFYDQVFYSLRAARKAYYKVHPRYFHEPTSELLDLAKEAESRLLQSDIDILQTQRILDAIAEIYRGESWASRYRPLFLVPALSIPLGGFLGLLHFRSFNPELAAGFAAIFVAGLVGCLVFAILLTDHSF